MYRYNYEIRRLKFTKSLSVRSNRPHCGSCLSVCVTTL